jgi:polysaccharide pyruvyl transferase WcaK-like protein
VVLRDWEHTVEGNKYCEQIELAVKQMRQNGLTVTYVLFAEAQDRYWKSWLGKRNETPLVWQPGKETVSSFMESLNTFDFFVTARYHAAVFGAILNKPAICINIDEKLKLASQLLIPDLPIWNPPFQVDELLNAIKLLTSDYEIHRSTLKINTNQQTKLAHKMLHDAVQKITE